MHYQDSIDIYVNKLSAVQQQIVHKLGNLIGQL